MNMQVDGKALNHALFAGGGFGVTVKEGIGIVTFEGNSFSVSRQIEEWIKKHPHYKVGVAKASFFGKHEVCQTIEYTQKESE